MLWCMAVMWRGQKAYAYQARNEARKQTDLLRQQTKLMQQAPPQGVPMPPAWYSDGKAWHWWDGTRWTGQSQPL